MSPPFISTVSLNID
jgi:tetratricopeptide (TPR) repeat protein